MYVCFQRIVGKSANLLAMCFPLQIQSHNSVLTEPTIPTLLLGNFKCIDLKKKNTEQKALKNKKKKQTKKYTHHAQIDLVYTNVPHCAQSASTL